MKSLASQLPGLRYHPVRAEMLSGFTLFYARHQGADKWQLSYRLKTEAGWFVNHVSDEIAFHFLKLLETADDDKQFWSANVTLNRLISDLIAALVDNMNARNDL